MLLFAGVSPGVTGKRFKCHANFPIGHHGLTLSQSQNFHSLGSANLENLQNITLVEGKTHVKR
jgi:hypothetical protein